MNRIGIDAESWIYEAFVPKNGGVGMRRIRSQIVLRLLCLRRVLCLPCPPDAPSAANHRELEREAPVGNNSVTWSFAARV